MNLFDRAKIYIAKRWFGFSNENSPIFQSLGVPGESTQKQAIDQYNGIVYACVSAVAEEVASVEHFVKKPNRAGELERSTSGHEFLRLLDNPNPQMTKFDLIEGTQSFIEMAGEAFWIFALGEITKRPKEVYLMRPDKMKVVVDDKDGSVKGYVLQKADGVQIPFSTKEVLHFKMFNPNNAYRGLGTVQAAMTYVETEKFASRFARNFLYNNATPTGVLSLQKNVNKDAMEKFKRMWAEGISGAENAGKIAIIRETDVKFEKIGLSLADIDLKALREMTDEQIMKMFRVPKGILAISDSQGLGRASVETLEYIFMKRVIEPKIKRLDDTLQLAIDKFYKDKAVICHSSIIPEDKEYNLKMLEAGTDKWITRDEAREETGLEALGADQLYNEINKLPIEVNKPKSKSATYKIKIKSTENAEKLVKDKKADYDVTDKSDSSRPEIFRKSVEAKISSSLLVITRIMRKYLDEQKKIVLEKIKPKKAFEESTFNPAEEAEKLVELLTPAMIDLLERAGKEALDFVGYDNPFQMTEKIQKTLRSHINKMATGFSEKTIDELAKTLSEGFTNGENINKLSKRVSEVYEQAKGYRTERVARAEAHWTAQEATQLAYQQTGYIKYKQWYANPNACQYCQVMDGQIVPLTESFFPQNAIVQGKDGGQYITSYEEIQNAHLHPNCECTILSLTEAKQVKHKKVETQVETEVNIKQLKKAKKVLDEAREISELLDEIEL